MELTIEQNGKPPLILIAKETESLKELKATLAEALGIPINRIRLSYKDHQLSNDNETLTNYGLQPPKETLVLHFYSIDVRKPLVGEIRNIEEEDLIMAPKIAETEEEKKALAEIIKKEKSRLKLIKTGFERHRIIKRINQKTKEENGKEAEELHVHTTQVFETVHDIPENIKKSKGAEKKDIKKENTKQVNKKKKIDLPIVMKCIEKLKSDEKVAPDNKRRFLQLIKEAANISNIEPAPRSSPQFSV